MQTKELIALFLLMLLTIVLAASVRSRVLKEKDRLSPPERPTLYRSAPR